MSARLAFGLAMFDDQGTYFGGLIEVLQGVAAEKR